MVKRIKLEVPSLASIVEALDMAKATAFDPAKLREHARRALYLIEARRAKTPDRVAWAVAIAQGQMKSPGELVGAAEHALQKHDCATCAELLDAAGAPGLAQLVAMCQPALERAWAEEAEG